MSRQNTLTFCLIFIIISVIGLLIGGFIWNVDEPKVLISKPSLENKVAKRIAIILALILGSITVGIIIYTLATVHEQEKKDYIFNTILPFFVGPLGAIALLFFSYLQANVTDKLDIQLEKIREEK